MKFALRARHVAQIAQGQTHEKSPTVREIGPFGDHRVQKAGGLGRLALEEAGRGALQTKRQAREIGMFKGRSIHFDP